MPNPPQGFDPSYRVVTASRVRTRGVFGFPAVSQAFAALVPLCLVVLGWATRW